MGDLSIRAGSQDYKTWQIQEDGVAVDLSAATSAILRMREKNSGTTKVFSTDDATQKFFISDASNGKVQFRPAADDFTEAATYYFYVDFVDSIGVHSVAENKNYVLKISDKIT